MGISSFRLFHMMIPQLAGFFRGIARRLPTAEAVFP
jgi:hypothetical protein